MFKTLLDEYGLYWAINRMLYSFKLKLLRCFPFSEILFEKKVFVKKIDILEFNVEKIEQFLNKLPLEKKQQIINIADKAINGIITSFSSIELDYGNPINWHYNPITKVKLNSKIKWYKIPDFDRNAGDIKTVWEASRFTHFLYFARAFLITKDLKYYNAYSDHLKNWISNNKYSFGANYKCGQEATLRMLNTLIAYSVFNSYGLADQKVKDSIYKIVECSYKKVLSNFFYAHKCIKNNHTLSEITGLIVGSLCSEDINMLKKSSKLLNSEIEKQFKNDGGYIQYSFNYQRFALQLMEFIFMLGKKYEVDISDKSKLFIKKSALLLYQVQDETGDVPNYGSNDGALIFPFSTCPYRDFRPVINTIYTFLEGKNLYNPGYYDEELLWFIKDDLYEDKNSRKTIERESTSFSSSGFYTLRHNNGSIMIVLNDFKTRPAHMDQLHIDLWHNGVNIFCDSGTFSYASDIGEKMVLTSAHNTIKVDNIDQMNKKGPFLIYNWTYTNKVEHRCDFFCGEMISKNGYKHKRKVKKTICGYDIEDTIIGCKSNCVSILHTPCDVIITSTGFKLRKKDTDFAEITTKCKVNVKTANRSLFYLKKELINQVSLSGDIVNNCCEISFEIKLI